MAPSARVKQSKNLCDFKNMPFLYNKVVMHRIHHCSLLHKNSYKIILLQHSLLPELLHSCKSVWLPLKQICGLKYLTA